MKPLLRNDLQAAINILPQGKRLFAKMLAGEDITVEHGNVPTAFFDMKNRLLMLPHWPNLSNEETEMLLAHEVGHAVKTPWEDWDKAIKSRPEDEQGAFKSYLNVVEDARIERIMKDRWPGLAKTFYEGYHQLHHTRDIFQIRKRKMGDAELAKLRRIDRLNLAAKIGAELQLILTDEDQKIYDRMMDTQEFDEVVKLAEELFEREKEEPQQGGGDSSDEEGDGEAGDGEEGDGTGTPGGKKKVKNAKNYLDELGAEEAAKKAKEEAAKKGQQGKDGKDGKDGQQNGSKAGPGANASPEPAMTHDTWESFVTEQSGYDKQKAGTGSYYRHSNMSAYNTVTLSDVPMELYSKFVEPMSELVAKFRVAKTITAPVLTHMADWKRDFVPTLSSMVQQFQRHQKARESFKVMEAQTGKLDMTKLPFYTVSDNIFKKNTILPKGKNHGVVMLVDWSGSMGCYIAGVVEQMLMLAMFCERIRIPLEIYAFTDTYARNKWSWTPTSLKSISPLNCGLIQFYTSDAPKRLRDEAFQCMYATKYVYDQNDNRTNREIVPTLPAVLNLGGTPLHSSLLLMKTVLKHMRRNHNLDRQAFMLVSDGDGGDWLQSANGGTLSDGGSARDEKTGIMYRSKLPMGTLVEWLKDTTGSTTIGIRLMHGEAPEHIARAWVSEQADRTKAAEALRSREPFISIPHTDFDLAFAVRSTMQVSRASVGSTSDPLLAKSAQRRDLMRFTNALIQVIA